MKVLLILNEIKINFIVLQMQYLKKMFREIR